MATIECLGCHQQRQSTEMIPSSRLVPHITERLKEMKPDWDSTGEICEHCLNEALAAEAEEMLKAEMQGDLTPLEWEVISSLRQGGMMAQNVAEMDDDQYLTAGERFADRVANTVGSFTFASLVLIAVVVWLIIGMYTGLMERSPAFVFGGLSSVLGALAAVQNPIILMSQRRAARRDRIRNENDYRVNLKSELEVRYLNAKLDYMLDRISELHTDEKKP